MTGFITHEVPAVTTFPTQGIHHITFMGADRQTSVDFWQGVLGMPLVFEQPNLDDARMNHLYFDPGDGCLITVFTSEEWPADARPNPTNIGNLHHLAFAVSREVFDRARDSLQRAGFANSGEVDRGFMWSLYFRDPLGQLLELACYKFTPPAGRTHADVLREAHAIRVEQGAANIELPHLEVAIERLKSAAHR